LPDQTGHDGKVLSTNGTAASWTEIASDSVLEYASSADFPGTGVVNTLYVATNTNLLYRWDTDTSTYILLGDTPTTIVPSFASVSVTMNEMDETALAIQNYNSENAYTVESLDMSKATVLRSESFLIISTKHVEANTSVSVRIKSTAPEFHPSDWTTITVDIETIVFHADDAIQVTDFTNEAMYNMNWSLV